jgi:50S ribosomal subunit-associated GTPase HflX
MPQITRFLGSLEGSAIFQILSYGQVLKEIGATEVPIITVWNKMDLVRDPEMVIPT